MQIKGVSAHVYLGNNFPSVKLLFCQPWAFDSFLRQVNIMTDFVDAEIFLIDGDSLLLDLFGERRLDWNNGGQFLHLTYLVERFLQYFTDKG